MWLGERAALVGLLAAVRPVVAIEIGTAAGGSLKPISAYSDAVHAFDRTRHPDVTAERFPNVEFHTGDSHVLLPRVLDQLTSSGTNVDFALVDGDHSPAGVRRDLEDLLSSPSVERTVILVHDTLNDGVRVGVEQVEWDRFEKVRFVDLDFVPGRVMATGPNKDNLWSGFGLIVTDLEVGDVASWPLTYPAPEVYGAFAEAHRRDGAPPIGHAQMVELQTELADQQRLVSLMRSSWSWRLTRPLRAGRDLLPRRSR